MKSYWLIWTYIGNYSEKPFHALAASAEAAASLLYEAFSDDFRAKGKVYVFEVPPVLTMYKGKAE